MATDNPILLAAIAASNTKAPPQRAGVGLLGRAVLLTQPAAAPNLPPAAVAQSGINRRAFIAHGHNDAWKFLEIFLREELGLIPSFYELTSAGTTNVPNTVERAMLGTGMAFIVLTRENQHIDGSWHARYNVVDEGGQCRGRLGVDRTFLLLETGCEFPSNYAGRDFFEFRPNRIQDAFWKITKAASEHRLIPAQRREQLRKRLRAYDIDTTY